MAHLSVARLIFNRTIQPDRKRRLWDRMPGNLAHARWDAGEADAGRLITGIRSQSRCLRAGWATVEYEETSDGEVRHVPGGSFVLVEDTYTKLPAWNVAHLSHHW